MQFLYDRSLRMSVHSFIVHPPTYSGSAPWSPPRQTYLEHLQRVRVSLVGVQSISIQRTSSSSLSSLKMSKLLTLSPFFSSWYPQSYSVNDYPELVTIGEGWVAYHCFIIQDTLMLTPDFLSGVTVCWSHRCHSYKADWCMNLPKDC